MKWPWVSRRAHEWLVENKQRFHEHRVDELYKELAHLEVDRDYFRSAYYDLLDIVAEQRDAIEHYEKLVSGQLGDGPK